MCVRQICMVVSGCKRFRCLDQLAENHRFAVMHRPDSGAPSPWPFVRNSLVMVEHHLEQRGGPRTKRISWPRAVWIWSKVIRPNIPHTGRPTCMAHGSSGTSFRRRTWVVCHGLQSSYYLSRMKEVVFLCLFVCRISRNVKNTFWWFLEGWDVAQVTTRFGGDLEAGAYASIGAHVEIRKIDS